MTTSNMALPSAQPKAWPQSGRICLVEVRPYSSRSEKLMEFAIGVDGNRPTLEIIQIGEVIVKAVMENVPDPEIDVDIDGALSFDLRLPDGKLVLAELSVDGRLEYGLYDQDNQLLDYPTSPLSSDLVAEIKLSS